MTTGTGTDDDVDVQSRRTVSARRPARAKDQLDEFVRAFERAHSNHGYADPADFLPPPDHPLFAKVLRELVRVDMEFGWERGQPKDLKQYLHDFPRLVDDRQGLREIAFEEFRLRCEAGENPTPEDYLMRYGIRLDNEIRRLPAATMPADGNHASGRRFAVRPPRPIPKLPAVGDEFLGFRLVGELGHGSFGKVYLALQKDLQNRPVVLKITTDGPDEAQTLAQLQHDNIVPIYSRHRSGALRAVCMPYLGAVTLRDVFNDLKTQKTLPGTGRELLSSLAKSSVLKAANAGADSYVTAIAPESETGSARRRGPKRARGGVDSARTTPNPQRRPWSRRAKPPARRRRCRRPPCRSRRRPSASLIMSRRWFG